MASSPAPDTKLAAAPSQVTLTFNEPVQLLRSDDVTVVDEDGTEANSAPASNGADERTVQIPLRPGLPDGTYTVRYLIIGADSHVIPGAYVFGIGPGPLGDPVFSAGGGGPSETGPWGTSSRFLEIVGLGGLVGLLAFRWLVWAPAIGRMPGVRPAEQEAVLNWGRDTFWVGFGVFAIGAMIAEGYLLVVQSAAALGTGVWSALRDTNGISQVLSDTRFGSLVQLRGALLFALFAIGAVLFIREYGSSGAPKPATVTGSKTAGALMAVLLIVVLGGIASQGHANVAEMSNLQVAAQAIHIVAVAVWIVGLAMVAIIMLRLPRVAADAGARARGADPHPLLGRRPGRRGGGDRHRRLPLDRRALRPGRAVGDRLRPQHPLQGRAARAHRRDRPLQPAHRGGAPARAAPQRAHPARWCGAPRAPSWPCRW